MNPQLLNFISQHWFGVLSVVGYISLTGINQMAPPGVKGGGAYGWFYRTTQSLAGSAVIKNWEMKFGLQPVPNPPPSNVSTTQHGLVPPVFTVSTPNAISTNVGPVGETFTVSTNTGTPLVLRAESK
jgi:hypothetical protein